MASNVLEQVFSIKDLGHLNYFLGMEVTHVDDGIVLTQKKFTTELLNSCPFDSTKPVTTPLPLNLKLTTHSTELSHPDPAMYRSLVGKLNFLTNTRPDLAYTVQTLSLFMHDPKPSHFEALQHTLRYVSCTAGQGILLNATAQMKLQAFSDSDWASCPDTRRSVTGYVVLLGTSPISWKSKKQSVVSRSSAEAEYRAISNAAAEVTWLVRLLEDLGVNKLQPVSLHCDNQSAIYISKNPVFHDRTKHIEVDCHFTRDKIVEGLLELTYLPSKSQLAGILTKVIPGSQFHDLRFKLGMFPSHSSLRGDVGNEGNEGLNITCPNTCTPLQQISTATSAISHNKHSLLPANSLQLHQIQGLALSQSCTALNDAIRTLHQPINPCQMIEAF